jgi:hypothetical protein
MPFELSVAIDFHGSPVAITNIEIEIDSKGG